MKIERTKQEANVLKLDRKIRRRVRKARAYTKLHYSLWLGSLILMGLITYLACSWFNKHEVHFQSPVWIKAFPTPTIKIWSPVPTDYIRPSPRPTIPEAGKSAVQGKSGANLISSEYDMVMALKTGAHLWKMYQLETQRGKTDFCRNDGLGYGGWGVKDNEGIHCYPTFKEAAERADYWLTNIMKGRTLSSALCKWSGHGDVDSCTYSENFMTL